MIHFDKEVNNDKDTVNLFEENLSSSYVSNDITCP